MATLDILVYTDNRLRKVAKSVELVDDKVRDIVNDMFETMYEAPGIGLAATQVNIHQRIVVIDVSEDKSEPLTLVNPEIVNSEGLAENEEGCLSLPGVFEMIKRPEKITFKALNRDGEPYEMAADGLLAVCVQHEIDHLDGKMFVDYLSGLKRRRITKKMIKHEKDK